MTIDIKNNERHRHLLFSSNKLEILPVVQIKNEVFVEKRPIVFIQSAKTGSTNIIYLMKAIAQEQNFLQLGYSAPGLMGSHTTFVEGFLGGLNIIKASPNNCDCSKKNIKFIYSHMPLPEVNYFNSNVEYISLVREPLDRALSLVNFLYQRKYLEASEMENYILNIEIDNLQTRFLAGEQYMRGKCTEATFEQAKQNIQNKFSLVAPTEEVRVVMAVLAEHFGVINVASGNSQVTKVKLLNKENTELCDKIKQKDYFDSKLYDFVKENWNLWKEQHIDSVTENRNASSKYMVISSEFYQTRKISYMTLSEIDQSNELETDLTGVIQSYS